MQDCRWSCGRLFEAVNGGLSPLCARNAGLPMAALHEGLGLVKNGALTGALAGQSWRCIGGLNMTVAINVRTR
eukprot:1143379-Pelagomonas_calceolata.AAC.2